MGQIKIKYIESANRNKGEILVSKIQQDGRAERVNAPAARWRPDTPCMQTERVLRCSGAQRTRDPARCRDRPGDETLSIEPTPE